MPRGGARATKRAPPKRGNRKAAAAGANEEGGVQSESLPDLAQFLIDRFDLPDVTDILAGGAYKEASQAFSDVAQYREQLKEALAPCYEKRRMPRTPRKLIHKAPAQPIPVPSRILDFGIESPTRAENATASGDSTLISVTGKVPQTPDHKIQPQGSKFNLAERSGGNLATQSPANRFFTSNAVINATPSAPAALYSSSSTTPRTLTNASRPLSRAITPKSMKPVDGEKKICELNQKLEHADERRKEHIRDQQERIARDIEQRKRRVNQNLLAKQQEEERKKEELRMQQERIRQFEEAQRTPKTPSKLATPSKILTPGQKAVPQKRQKQDESVKQQNGTIVAKAPGTHVSRLPVPKPRLMMEDPPATRTEPPAFIERHNSIPIVERDSVNREEQPYEAVEPIDVDEAPESTKENQPDVSRPLQAPMRTPLAAPQLKRDESAYEMTPDKVFQPATENDYNVNDLSSNDETDDEDNPRKRVPRWAERANLQASTRKLFNEVSKDEINAFFGVLKPPKISTLFANTSKDYESFANETTAWESPIANPRTAPLRMNCQNRMGQ